MNQPRLTTEENSEIIANQVIALPAGANELLMEEGDNGQVKFVFMLYTIWAIRRNICQTTRMCSVRFFILCGFDSVNNIIVYLVGN